MSGWQSRDQSSDPHTWAEADLEDLLVTLELQQVDNRPVDVSVENGHDVPGARSDKPAGISEGIGPQHSPTIFQRPRLGRPQAAIVGNRLRWTGTGAARALCKQAHRRHLMFWLALRGPSALMCKNVTDCTPPSLEGRVRHPVSKGLASVFLLLCAACGGAGSTPQVSPTAEAITLRLGLIPIADVAPIYLGVEQGYFKEQNLTLDRQLAQGGAAIIPAVVSGDYQFGFSNLVSEILAFSRGLKLQIVSQGVQAGDNPRSDPWAILALKDAFTTCKNLEGKTIAVNTLKNVGEITIKAACEQQGANVSSFRLIEMNFPEMLPAMQGGRIDAMWTVEPFVTQAKQANAHVISYNVVATAPRMTVATYFTTADYAAKNKGVVTRFQKAVNKSLDYAASHPDAVRQIVPTYTRIAAATVQAMVLPYMSHDLNKPTIEKQADLMVKYGLLDKKPDLSKLYGG